MPSKAEPCCEILTVWGLPVLRAGVEGEARSAAANTKDAASLNCVPSSAAKKMGGTLLPNRSAQRTYYIRTHAARGGGLAPHGLGFKDRGCATVLRAFLSDARAQTACDSPLHDSLPHRPAARIGLG